MVNGEKRKEKERKGKDTSAIREQQISEDGRAFPRLPFSFGGSFRGFLLAGYDYPSEPRSGNPEKFRVSSTASAMLAFL